MNGLAESSSSILRPNEEPPEQLLGFLRLLNLSGACFYFAAICGIISLLQSSATYAEATLDLSPLTMSWITYTHLFCSQTSACELSASLWRLRVCY